MHLTSESDTPTLKANRGRALIADEYIDKNRASEITISFSALRIIHAAVIISL